jgi:hypothetical protein
LIADSSLAVEDSADHLEWACLDSEGYLAWADVIRELRLTFSQDEAATTRDQGQTGIEPFETILDEWVAVLGHRDRACGPSDAYPFNISQHGLELRDSPSAAYLFQLLVSLGFKEDHRDGTTVYKLFEELSAAAAGRYLGDSRTAVVFGSPRHDLPAGFREAVAHLANLLREGKACADHENLTHSKDDGLDVVAWKEFPDRRASKLILFGQCAVGRHWQKKTHELRPRRWCKRNFAGPIAVDPIPAFFVPRALSEGDASDAGCDQILLDRCRISALSLDTMDSQLDERLREWIEASLQAGHRP